jgi:hypothetical protein
MGKVVTFIAPPWWDEALAFFCRLQDRPQPPDPNPSPPDQEWQLGITVTPADATVTVRQQRARVTGVREGDSAHYLIAMHAPPFEIGAFGRLVVEAPGYVTYDEPLPVTGRPDELPAVTLEVTEQSWALGLSVSPEDAHAFMDTGGQRVEGVVDAGGGAHRLLHFEAPPCAPNAPGQLTVEAPGHATSITSMAIGPDQPAGFPHWPELPMVTLERVAPVLTPLRINGKFFEQQDGTPHARIACSDFGLIRLMAAGQDIVPILRERVQLGFNEVRVFSMMCGTLGRLLPTEIPDYYTKLLPTFLALAEAEGLRVELTALVDANGDSSNGAHWSQQQRIEHFEQCAAILRARAGVPHFLERVNENDQLMNATPMDGFLRPVGIWACSGSYGADVIPPVYAPQWDYGTIHPARPPDWPRKAVHNPMEDIADRCGIPATANELCRPDQGRGPVPGDHFDCGAGMLLLHNGGCFHSEAGKYSTLLAHNGTELSCAQAFIAGVRAVPLDYRYGQYTAGHLSEMPIETHPAGGEDPLVWNSRAYARIVGGQACAVVIQRTEAFEVKPLNGWTIVEQIESVFYCTR